jgi:hypothetical protein
MRRRSPALDRARAIPWSARCFALLAVAVAAVPAALVTGSELGLTSGALAATSAHPFALALGAAAMVGALMLTIERPRSRSLRAYGEQLARRFHLTHAAVARSKHQEQQP